MGIRAVLANKYLRIKLIRVSVEVLLFALGLFLSIKNFYIAGFLWSGMLGGFVFWLELDPTNLFLEYLSKSLLAIMLVSAFSLTAYAAIFFMYKYSLVKPIELDGLKVGQSAYVSQYRYDGDGIYTLLVRGNNGVGHWIKFGGYSSDFGNDMSNGSLMLLFTRAVKTKTLVRLSNQVVPNSFANVQRGGYNSRYELEVPFSG